MSQFHDMSRIQMKKEGEEVLKEFKSIAEKKLKQPLDLKKIYYEQMEHLP